MQTSNGFLWAMYPIGRIWHLPFFLSSGLPFLTVAKTMSPLAAAGRRLRRPLIPPTAMMYRFLAPVKESS